MGLGFTWPTAVEIWHTFFPPCHSMLSIILINKFYFWNQNPRKQSHLCKRAMKACQKCSPAEKTNKPSISAIIAFLSESWWDKRHLKRGSQETTERKEIMLKFFFKNAWKIEDKSRLQTWWKRRARRASDDNERCRSLWLAQIPTVRRPTSPL